MKLDRMREAARRRVPKGIFQFIDRGAEDDEAIANNREAFRRLKLVPQVMVDATSCSTQSMVFGKPQAMPLAIAPTGAAGLVCFKGELQLARAAAKAGIPFTLATRSMDSIEEIAEAGGTLWFQLYLWKDRAKTYKLLERVSAAGIDVLMVTLDVPVEPNREFNRRNGFTFPFSWSLRSAWDMALRPFWLLNVIGRYQLSTGLPDYSGVPPLAGDITLDDIRELRKRWRGTLLVKGVLRPEDARRAVACGADGVIVSNHGGRCLDAVVATMDALPAIVDAVGRSATVLVDSGIRRGTDVVKALSLGASAVLSGRPCLYGLAVAGQSGAERVLSMLQRELLIAMAQVGCTSTRDLGPHIVHGALPEHQVAVGGAN